MAAAAAENDTVILSQNWNNVLEQSHTIIQNIEYTDTKDGNENFREKISFSFLSRNKIEKLYNLLRKKILEKIKINKNEENQKKSAAVLGISRRHIKDLNLIFAFVYILYNMKPKDYSSIKLKNMFQYVYDNIDLTNEDIQNIIKSLKYMIFNIEPNFICTRTDVDVDSKQNKCIGINLLNNIENIAEDDALFNLIESYKVMRKVERMTKAQFLEYTAAKLIQMIHPGFEQIEQRWQNVIYTTLNTTRKGICSSMKLPRDIIFGTDFTDFKIEFGIDLDTFKFVIFRWGRWREFDPINYVIKVDISGNETKDKELRQNPLNPGHVYFRSPKFYHTVLRKLDRICKDGTNNNETVFYYSIIHRTFFRQGDCEPVKIYSRIEDEPNKCLYMKELINCTDLNEEFENYSKFRINIAKTILDEGNRSCHNKDEFLFPFVQEFYGAMDEILADARISMVENMILNKDDIDQTIFNHTMGAESAAERIERRAEEREAHRILAETIERRAQEDAAERAAAAKRR
jgi:hypothetical protein